MVDSNKITHWLVALLGMAFSVTIVPYILNSSTGVVAPAILLFGVGLAFLAAIRPKIGLYLATFEVIYLDYFKKLAVYYGEATERTIIQVLVVSMATILCVYLGLVIQYILGKVTFRKLDFLLFAGITLLGAVTFFYGKQQFGSTSAAGQTAVNLTIYAGLIVAMPILLRDRKSLETLLKFVVICFIPWSIMGIYQYFFGFNKIELFYAETGLSPVSSNQFYVALQTLGQAKPMGFGSGSVNFGAVGLLLPLCLWMTMFSNKQRIFWGIASGFIFAAMVVSLQRSALLTPFIGVAFYFFTKSWHRLMMGYLATAVLLITGIIYSEFLLERLDDINAAIAVEGRWGETVLKVGTFSDRLRGWERLRNPETYSLLGALGGSPPAAGSHHDMINVILDRTGILGLLLLIGTALFAAIYVHRVIFSIEDKRNRSLARLLMAAMVPIFIIGMLGGSNFHANPFNFIMWLHLGAIFCLLTYQRESLAVSRNQETRKASSPPLAIPAS